MADANGWPAQPGVPVEPEREGHHWCFVYPSLPFPMIWRHDGIGWVWGNGYRAKDAAKHWHYLGPCLLPSEVQAQVAAARRAGIEAAAKVAEAAPWYSCSGEWKEPGRARIAAAIRALLEEPGA